MRGFCCIQPVKMHLPRLRRPMSSIQSAYHHPLMHDAHHNRRIPDTKRGERWSVPYLRCSPSTVIETWALECVFYKKYSGCCDMAKVLCILCTGSVIHIHQTLCTSTSVPLLRVGFCLFCAQICHAAWLCHTTRYRRCPPSMVYTAVYDGWLSPGAKSPSTVTVEYMVPFHQWCMVVIIGCQVA